MCNVIFDISIHCEMITTIKCINITIIFQSYHFCVCVVKILEIWSLHKFQICNTLLICIVIIRSPELIHVITKSVFPLITIFPFSIPQPLIATILFSVNMSPMFYLLKNSLCKWDYATFVYLRLVYLLSIVLSTVKIFNSDLVIIYFFNYINFVSCILKLLLEAYIFMIVFLYNCHFMKYSHYLSLYFICWYYFICFNMTT